MRRIVVGLMALAVSLFAWTAAEASLVITIDKATQRMSVVQNGKQKYVWPVSTGGFGYATPSGSYRPFRMELDHFSKEWDDAPMPHSIFFTSRGHAIHGSFSSRIGQRASHGCVRLSPGNAATLYSLVKSTGMDNTRIVVTGGFDFQGLKAPAFKAQPFKGPKWPKKIELAPGLKKLFQKQ